MRRNRRVNTGNEETRVADIRLLARDRRSRSQNSSVDSVPDGNGRLNYTASGFIFDVNNLMEKFPDMANNNYYWSGTEKKIVLSFYLAVFVRYELGGIVNNEFHEMISYIVDDILSKGEKQYRITNWNAAGFRSMFSDLLEQTNKINSVDSSEFKQQISKTKEHVETLLVKYQWCYKELSPDAEFDDSDQVAYPDRPKCTPMKPTGEWVDYDRYDNKRSYLRFYDRFWDFMSSTNEPYQYLSGLIRGHADTLDLDDIDVGTRLKF